MQRSESELTRVFLFESEIPYLLKELTYRTAILFEFRLRLILKSTFRISNKCILTRLPADITGTPFCSGVAYKKRVCGL